MNWTLPEAVTLLKKVENICPAFGRHVALTGGVLYKEGGRKDLDMLFYRIRQVDDIRRDELLNALRDIGFTDIQTFGWINKAKILGKSVDMFFPEYVDPPGGYRGYR